MKINQTISHYKILEQLGQGGMGVVYKAYDTKLKREVAIKFLSPDISLDDQERERFMIEAQAAAALNHPNIATIHAIEEVNDELFIVMEYIDGPDLKKKAAGEQLSVDNVIDMAIQIAAGLQAAHEKGITHRDIKPANIMLTSKDQVKITDFGLAKMAQASVLTKAGMTVGTMAYMSPEQAQGLEVDQRTDIWALGAVLYEMLTGQQPFAGLYEQAVLYAVVNTEPPALAALRPEIPAELERLVRKALQKNPAQRHQSMNEVTADLKLAGAKAATKLPAPEEKSRLAIAVLPFTDLSPQKDQEYFCDGMTEELIDALTKLEGCRVVSRTSAFAFKGKEQDIRAIGKQLNVSHTLAGSVRKAGNRLRINAQLTNVEDGFQLWSEKYDRELDDVFAIQDDIASALVKKLKMKLTSGQESRLVKRYTENLDAYNLYLQARFHLNKRTEEGLHKGVAYCEQAIALDPEYALAYAGLADGFALLGFQGFLPPAEAMPKAKTAAEQALAIDEALAEAHTSRGCIRAIYERNWPESAKAFKRALELNPNSSSAHYWYALWYLLPTGEFDLCLAEIQKAQELDPLSLVLNTGIGWQFYFAREFDRAIAALKKIIDLDGSFIFAHDVLGQTYAQKGMPEDAIAELEKAVNLSNRRTLSLGALGHAYAVAGRRDEARKILTELLEQAKGKYVSAYDIALIYTGMGEAGPALEWLEKAYDEHNGWLSFLNIEPRFDALRPDARFQELIKKVGLKI
jgi:serine/threonine protein kinase/Tfp pilus assembly protein PilF